MSIYPTESLCQSEDMQDIDSLIETLEQLKTSGCNYIEVVAHADDTRISISDAVVSVELLERTLSDDSKAHDIRLTFSEA